MGDHTERFTALPWVVWAAVMSLVILSTSNVLVLAAMAIGCWIAMTGLGASRASSSRLVAGTSLLLAALWAVLGVLIHRDGLGGPVIWFLPSWSAQSGGDFGGSVTAGQLHFALARGCQSLAIVAVIGVILRAVPADSWLRLADVVGGRVGRLAGPVLCLGQAYVEHRGDHVAARRAGFPTSGATATVVDVTERARALARRPGLGTTSYTSAVPTARAILAMAAALLLLTWWATSAIDPQTAWDLTGLERTFVVLASLVVLGVVLRPRLMERPTPGDLVPLVSAAVVAGAWLVRGRTGETADLVVDFAHVPDLPVVMVASLVALPVLALAGGGRR